jgi:predicted nucleic acid-binding protein
MREHGIRESLTRDTDFHRFPFVKVIFGLEIENLCKLEP